MAGDQDKIHEKKQAEIFKEVREDEVEALKEGRKKSKAQLAKEDEEESHYKDRESRRKKAHRIP